MRRIVRLWIGLLFVPSALEAQIDATVAGPPMLPNYERIPVGEQEALEAGAFIARTGDANSNWYNPAGLARVERTGANLSASAYEATTIEVASIRLESSNLRLSPLGAFFGLAIGEPLTSSTNVRYGFFIARPVAWQSGTLDESIPMDPQTTFGATSDATLTRMEPGIAIGIRANDHLRLGASLGVSVTTVSMSQDLSLRYAGTDSSSTTRRQLTINGSAWHLVPRLGMQWDAGEHWQLGATASAPGLQMLGSSSASLDAGNYSSEDRYREITFRDEEADFEYGLPFSAGLGIAWIYARGSIEGTVRYYGASDDFDFLSTDVAARQVDAVGASPPVISTSAVAPIIDSWRGVTNFAVGGNYGISEALRIHAGIHTDSSPVDDPARSMFRKVNLVGGTAGISYSGTTFGASLGLGYSAGHSDPIEQVAGFAPSSVETRLKVSTFRAMYSFSARF